MLTYMKFKSRYRDDVRPVLRYGQLQHLIDLPVEATTHELAIIKPCKLITTNLPTGTRNAYKELAGEKVVAVLDIVAVVGRVQDSRSRWCILDRKAPFMEAA
jgi:hypothetical protein